MDSIMALKCGLCGSNAISKFMKFSKVNSASGLSSASSDKLEDDLVRCRNCKIVFTYPRSISEEDLSQYADAENFDHQSQDKYREITFKRAIGKYLKTFRFKEPILDIGCATGSFLSCLHSLGFRDFEGIEPSEWSVSYIRNNLNFNVKSGYFSASLYSKKFNFITAWDVIEHVPDPVSFINEIKKIILDGGYLFLNTPNHDSLSRKIFRRNWPFYLKVHLYYFNDFSLKYLLGKHGFKLVESKVHSQTLGLGYLLYRTLFLINKKIAIRLKPTLFKIDWIPVTYRIGQKGYLFKYEQNHIL